MAARVVDLSKWNRANQFRFSRTFQKPYYAITSQLDLTRLLLEAKRRGVSPFRASVYAKGAGIHALPEEVVTEYSRNLAEARKLFR